MLKQIIFGAVTVAALTLGTGAASAAPPQVDYCHTAKSGKITCNRSLGSSPKPRAVPRLTGVQSPKPVHTRPTRKPRKA